MKSPPLVTMMFDVLDQSLRELRTEIKNPRFGPVENEVGYILFEFRDKTYKAPEPTAILFGMNAEFDRRFALKSLFNGSAKTNDGLSFEENMIKAKIKWLEFCLDRDG